MRRNKVKSFAFLCLLILSALGTVTPSPGQPMDLCRASGHAVILSDPTKTEEEIREIAERTAWIVAMRNLGEQIKGVRIDAKTTVQDYIARNDRVRSAINALVQKAHIVETKYLKDGTVEVVLETDCNNILEMISSRK